MKKIEVVAAIIHDAEKHTVLATQRGYGEFQGGWEFPGGKMEAGETPEVALIREIQEELDVTVAIDSFLCTVEYDYPTFHITMHCFVTHIVDGELTLLEHEDARWLHLDELDSVDWLPADIPAVQQLKEKYAHA